MQYVVRRAAAPPELEGDWDGPIWAAAETLEVAQFLQESSDHRPLTLARLLYDDEAIYGIFCVQDKYVRCVNRRFQDQVCHDSCVEFFVQPNKSRTYFNFEFNCSGGLLAYHIIDPTRTDVGFKAFAKLTPAEGRLVRIYHSLSGRIDPEIAEDTTWVLEFAAPFSLFSKRLGDLGAIPGQRWRANFYKCGDETSHPHWASWAPLDEKNFHLPRCFGDMTFED